MTTIEIPLYVDPAVLEPGARVVCMLDGSEETLTVVSVEPALVCTRPDGSDVVVLAHTCMPLDTGA